MRAISGLRRASDITSVHSFTCSIERTREVVMRHAFQHGEQALRQVGAARTPAPPRRGRARRCRRSAPPWRGSSGRDCPRSCRPRRRFPASRPDESPSARSSAGRRSRISARRSDCRWILAGFVMVAVIALVRCKMRMNVHSHSEGFPSSGSMPQRCAKLRRDNDAKAEFTRDFMGLFLFCRKPLSQSSMPSVGRAGAGAVFRFRGVRRPGFAKVPLVARPRARGAEHRKAQGFVKPLGGRCERPREHACETRSRSPRRFRGALPHTPLAAFANRSQPMTGSPAVCSAHGSYCP